MASSFDIPSMCSPSQFMSPAMATIWPTGPGYPVNLLLTRGSQVIADSAHDGEGGDPTQLQLPSLQAGDVLDVYLQDSNGNSTLAASATYSGTPPAITSADCQQNTVSGTAPGAAFVAGYVGTGATADQAAIGAAVTNGSFTLASKDTRPWDTGGQVEVAGLVGISYVQGPDGVEQVDQWTQYRNTFTDTIAIPQDVPCGSAPGPNPPPTVEPVVRVDTLTLWRGMRTGKINVLANDSDPSGYRLSVTGVTRPKAGSIKCAARGLCTYTAGKTFPGFDSVQYTVSDGHGGTAKGRLKIRYRPLPHGSFSSNGHPAPCVFASLKPYKHSDKIGRKWVYGDPMGSCLDFQSAAFHAELDETGDRSDRGSDVAALPVANEGNYVTLHPNVYVCSGHHMTVTVTQKVWVNLTTWDGKHLTYRRQSPPYSFSEC